MPWTYSGLFAHDPDGPFSLRQGSAGPPPDTETLARPAIDEDAPIDAEADAVGRRDLV